MSVCMSVCVCCVYECVCVCVCECVCVCVCVCAVDLIIFLREVPESGVMLEPNRADIFSQ